MATDTDSYAFFISTSNADEGKTEARENMSTKNIPNSLAHYTSVEVVLHLLQEVSVSKKTKEPYATFHLSHLNMMNDLREGHHILDRYFTESNKKQELNKKWQNFISKNTPFVMSTIKSTNDTKNKGSIPLWCMYGDNFKGAYLIFEYQELKKYCENEGLTLENCKYLKHNELKDKITKLNSIEFDAEELLKTAVFTKSIDWKHENEWRILKKVSDVDTIKYKKISKGIIEYTELPIPLTTIKTICTGPMTLETNYNSLESLILNINRKYNTSITIIKSKLSITL